MLKQNFNKANFQPLNSKLLQNPSEKREFIKILYRINPILEIFVFTLLTGFSAIISIHLPFTPVPITFQTLTVISSGFLLGKRKGTIAQIAYIFAGLLGIPWFSGMKSGFSAVLGPTGGYLIGFIFSAWVAGLLREKMQNFHKIIKIFIVGLISNIIIYIFGLSGLILQGFPIGDALAIGLFPFIPGDLFKLGILLLLLSSSINKYSFKDKLVPTTQISQSAVIKFAVLTVLSGIMIVYLIYLYSFGTAIPPHLSMVSLIIASTFVICLTLACKLAEKKYKK